MLNREREPRRRTSRLTVDAVRSKRLPISRMDEREALPREIVFALRHGEC
jgi:hypothetical protein